MKNTRKIVEVYISEEMIKDAILKVSRVDFPEHAKLIGVKFDEKTRQVVCTFSDASFAPIEKGKRVPTIEANG